MQTSDRLSPFGVTIFTEMTELARAYDAINLGQGFPNWDGADFVKKAAAQATLEGGHDQYPPSPGIPELRSVLAGHYGPLLARDIDPDTEVTVTCGCTEALAASLLGLVDPGDEVILIEPFYDAYPADVAMAGGVPRFVTLKPPDFDLEEKMLRPAFGPKTRAIVLNNPHNPSGRVLTRQELSLIAELCIEHDAIVIADEVYEEMVYEGEHLRIAAMDGMWDRTLTLSSLGKTFSLTGWKVGWAVGPSDLTAGLRAAHQFLTFTTPTPVQHGAAAALGAPQSFYDEMRAQYRSKRDLLAGGLDEIGFEVFTPEGTYFLMASHDSFGIGDDRAFCRHLVEKARVAAIPPSVFYRTPGAGSDLVRFAFCKDEGTLAEALDRMSGL